MRRLNRTQKIARNLGLAVLCAVLTWAASGFPAFTRGMMLWKAARENAVSQWQEIYAEPDRTMDTYKTEVIYLRSGDDFWSLRHSGPQLVWNVYLYDREGVLIIPSQEHSGAALAIGDVNAAAAELTWSMLRQEEPVIRTITGQRRSNHVFFFPMPEDLTEEQAARFESYSGSPWAGERWFDYALKLYDENGALIREVRY